jgi:hypothetical protein
MAPTVGQLAVAATLTLLAGVPAAAEPVVYLVPPPTGSNGVITGKVYALPAGQTFKVSTNLWQAGEGA